jgi:hypothetical protein
MTSLRQHYLEQVLRVSGIPMQDSQPSSRALFAHATGWLPFGQRRQCA